LIIRVMILRACLMKGGIVFSELSRGMNRLIRGCVPEMPER
jgi:hypothetical protein